MTFEDYKDKLNELRSEFSIKEDELMKEYVKSNDPYNIGDNFTDHIGTILIEKKYYGTPGLSNKPCVVYYGAELKKDGTPKKNGKKRKAWQSNAI